MDKLRHDLKRLFLFRDPFCWTDWAGRGKATVPGPRGVLGALWLGWVRGGDTYCFNPAPRALYPPVLPRGSLPGHHQDHPTSGRLLFSIMVFVLFLGIRKIGFQIYLTPKNVTTHGNAFTKWNILWLE